MSERNGNFLLNYNLQWFAKDGEGGEKTEPATQKKLQDARKDGKVAKSKELNSAFDLIVLFLVLRYFMSFIGENLLGVFTYIYGGIADFVRENAAGMATITVASLLNGMLTEMLLTLLPLRSPC